MSFRFTLNTAGVLVLLGNLPSRLIGAVLPIALFLIPDIASAEYVYTYSGPEYDYSRGPSYPAASMSVVIDSQSALAPSQTYSLAANGGTNFLLYMTDGYYSFSCGTTSNSCGGGYQNSSVTTNAAGQIVSWNFVESGSGDVVLAGVAYLSAGLISSSTPELVNGVDLYDQTETAVGVHASTTSGTTWSISQTSPVPLPAAAWLMLSGLGGLGAMARKRTAA
jgi:hypothetical protein